MSTCYLCKKEYQEQEAKQEFDSFALAAARETTKGSSTCPRCFLLWLRFEIKLLLKNK